MNRTRNGFLCRELHPITIRRKIFLQNHKIEPRYTIREEIQSDGVLSTISIKRAERGDSALFTCVATNAFGSDDTSVNLIIQEKPETPYGLKANPFLFFLLFFKGCPGWGASPGSFDFVYFLIPSL
jgi:hypothetical protein